MEFPELKRTVRELADLWNADVVLVEDKASGTQLIRELRAGDFSKVEAAPTSSGEKVMRLRDQTAKIEGGFVLFPKHERWLDAYLLELTTFPNAKNDDQVDSTVNALAWCTQEANKPGMGFFRYMKMEAEKLTNPSSTKMIRVWAPGNSSTWQLITGRSVWIPVDRIIEVTEEEADGILRNGGKRVD